MCLQAPERAGAGTELLGVDFQTPKHADIKIGQGWWIGRIERQVLTVSESAARQKHGQVAFGMAAGISQVAAEKHRRPVEQVAALFARLFQLGQEGTECPHFLHLYRSKLSDLPGVLPVVGQVVVAVRHSVDGRHPLAAADHYHRDQAAGIRLEDEVDQVEPGPCPREQIGVGRVRRARDAHLRLGFLRPFLRDGQALLQLPDAREILVQLLPVRPAQAGLYAPRRLADVDLRR